MLYNNNYKTNYIEMIFSINIFISIQLNNTEDSLFSDMLEEEAFGKKRVRKGDKQTKDKLARETKTVIAYIEFIYNQIGLYYILSITVGNKKYKVNRILDLGQNIKNKTIFGLYCLLLNSSFILYYNIQWGNIPNNKFLLSETQFKNAYQFIKARIIKNKYPVMSPIAIVLGGQPGAGKSNIYKIARKRFSRNIVELDCDLWRVYHPYWKEIREIFNKDDALKTNPFVFLVVDLLIEELSNEKYNLIIESSLNTPYSALEDGAKLPSKGYKIELQIMATPKQISWQGTIDRYNNELIKGGSPRAVSRVFHDTVVGNISSSLAIVKESRFMSNILIYNRNKDCLYDMKKDETVNPCLLLSYIINGDFSEKNKLEQFIAYLQNHKIRYNEQESVAKAIKRFNKLPKI